MIQRRALSFSWDYGPELSIVSVFFATQEIKKDAGYPEGTSAAPVGKLGVLGNLAFDVVLCDLARIVGAVFAARELLFNLLRAVADDRLLLRHRVPSLP